MMPHTLNGKPASGSIAAMIKFPYLVVRSAATDLLFDRRYGVRTAGQVEPGELGLDGRGCMGYRPAGWTTLRRILPLREVSDHDVFVDLGSGMGRVVLQAATYRFRKVIGVEISEALHRIAQENIERSRQRLRCPDIELVHADVLEYKFPDDVTRSVPVQPVSGGALRHRHRSTAPVSRAEPPAAADHLRQSHRGAASVEHGPVPVRARGRRMAARPGLVAIDFHSPVRGCRAADQPTVMVVSIP